MNRNPDETFIGYCQRLTEAVKRKEITYNEWAKGVVGDTNYGEESLRRASVIFGQFLGKWTQEGMENISDAEVLRQIELQRKELLKERKKLQTENTEYQANLRNEARGEMFNDKILDAIELLPKFKVHTVYEYAESKRTGVLCIADAHFGSVIELKSLFGEVVNQYNPDIFNCQASRNKSAKSNSFSSISMHSRSRLRIRRRKCSSRSSSPALCSMP